MLSGEYKIVVRYDGQEGYVSQWYNGKLNFESATPVRVVAPNVTTNILFRLNATGRINGFVKDAAGNRLTEAETPLQFYAYDANTGEYVDFESNTFNGGYGFDLLPGSYKIAAISIYGNYLPKQDSLAASFFENAAAFSDPGAKVLAVQSRASMKLNDVVLSKVGGAISGTIFEGTQPLKTKPYLLFAFDAAGFAMKYSSYAPPADGAYLITGLRPGNYYLLAAYYDEGAGRYYFQWFGGVAAAINENTFTPKINIPANVATVTVGAGLVRDKNFHFNLPTGVESGRAGEILRRFNLQQNYPNPFNPSTTIVYELPEAAPTQLAVYNLLGERVATLVDARQPAGQHHSRFEAKGLPSGIYFYKITAGRFTATKKMLLVR